MGYFPFFMEIEDKKGVVLGGGQVAARKVEKLLPFGPRLICIAPVICARIESLAQGADQLTLIYREACREDMDCLLYTSLTHTAGRREFYEGISESRP